MTLVINLSRAYKLSSPPQFQGDTLSQPSSSDLKFLTLASYSRLSNTDLKINTHRPLPSPPRLCPGKHPSPQLWALNTSNHSQVPCALPYKKPSEPAAPPSPFQPFCHHYSESPSFLTYVVPTPPEQSFSNILGKLQRGGISEACCKCRFSSSR